MYRYVIIMILFMAFLLSCKQGITELPVSKNENSLFWKVSGNGLREPTYLYGTMHILCSEDARISEHFKTAIREAEAVYFEIDMDDFEEMMAADDLMFMEGDTTLETLLTVEQLEKVRQYIEHKTNLPFSEVNKYKPILGSALLAEAFLSCKNKTGIEEVIMEEVQGRNKPVFGMETMEYQLGIMDSIPYAEQAAYLVDFVDSAAQEDRMKTQTEFFYKKYLDQEIFELEKLLSEKDPAMARFAELLVNKRNKNWVVKLKEIMKKGSLVIAVGAGHLGGEQGLINLLRKEGYTLTPMENQLPRKKK